MIGLNGILIEFEKKNKVLKFSSGAELSAE